MKHIEESKKVIVRLGGSRFLATRISSIDGSDIDKMLGRVRMWRVRGVSLPYIRLVAKLGCIAMSTLIPETDTIAKREIKAYEIEEQNKGAK